MLGRFTVLVNLRTPIVFRSVSLNRPRPSPHPLSVNEQREFEELVRKADLIPSADHPDHKPVKQGFDGEVNPETGEKGGPKREPIGRWGQGDWSFNGRVSDF